MIGEAAGTAGIRRVVLELERSRFADTAGLAALVRTRRRLGRRLAVVVPRESGLARLFGTAGLSDAFDVYESLAAVFSRVRSHWARLEHAHLALVGAEAHGRKA